jgi:hypothetical protein
MATHRIQKVFKESVNIEPGYDPMAKTFLPQKKLRVSTERHEVIYVPGNYTLGMPFLMLGEENEPIRVSVKVPATLAIEPFIDTQWAEHSLTKVPGDTPFWIFKGVISPGQFFELKLNQKTPQRQMTPRNTLTF